jgi:hypothetical protein
MAANLVAGVRTDFLVFRGDPFPLAVMGEFLAGGQRNDSIFVQATVNRPIVGRMPSADCPPLQTHRQESCRWHPTPFGDTA